MKTFLLSLILGAFSSVALASPDKMAELDANQDGLISIEEASADPVFAEKFASLDINQDGFVSASELEQS